MQTFLIGLVLVLAGLAGVFWGYRIFRILLPIYGGIAGFVIAYAWLGQSNPLLALIVGLVFAVILGALAYLFWSVAVGLAGIVLGMAIGGLIASALNLWTWLAILLILALAALFGWLFLKIRDEVVIIATVIAGAGEVAYGVGTWLGLKTGFGAMPASNPAWLLILVAVIWIALLIAGIVYQWGRYRNLGWYGFGGRAQPAVAPKAEVPATPAAAVPAAPAAVPAAAAAVAAAEVAARGVEEGEAVEAAEGAAEAAEAGEPAAAAVAAAAAVEVAGEGVEEGETVEAVEAAEGAAAAAAEAGEPVAAAVAAAAGAEVLSRAAEAEEVVEGAPAVPAAAAEEMAAVAEREEAEAAQQAQVEQGLAEIEATFPLEEMAKFKEALEFVEGIGPVYAGKLRDIGVLTVLDLLRRGATRKGRAEMAELSGIAGRLILEWVNHADLYRIKGVGSEWADLLEAAGVDTVVELAQRNPANLFSKMLQVNEAKKLVRRTPVQSQVDDWVAQAKKLPRMVQY